VRREGTDVVVQLPPALPDAIAAVVTLGIQGEPIVYRAPEIVAESDIFVRPLSVKIEASSPALEIHFTVDGTEPTEASPRYTKPLEIVRTTTLSARSFHKGRAVSSVARRWFECVRPLAAVAQPGAGVSVELYRGDWDRLPDFDNLQPEPRKKLVSDFALGIDEEQEYLGLRFKGVLEAPRDDVYVFALASDDGSDLWIDGQRVIDNDGLHGTVEKRGNIALAKGPHSVQMRWFNKTGGAELELKWAPLGGELRRASSPLQAKN
jgi:hypothetical protein